MRHPRRFRWDQGSVNPVRWVCLGLAVMLVQSIPAVSANPPEADPFPSYEAIEGNVKFWKSVWAEWGMSQVAVHDQEAPAIVYEVADLPGEFHESYTAEQREFIEELRERWEERLSDLARRANAGAALSDQDKSIVLQITTNAGTDALDDAHRRVRTQRGLRERFRRGLEISRRYDAEFRRIFREAGLPEDLAYLPHVESSFQASARSSAGAVGVWQFTRGTGKRYMSISSAIDERLDPIAAARGAAGYLREAYGELGSWPIALTSYNHGVGGMLRAVAQFGRDYETIYREYSGRQFGFASRNFYSEFLAAREIVREANRSFPEGLNSEPIFDLDAIVLDHGTNPAAIARAFGLELDYLATLNPGWSNRAVRGGLAIPKNTVVWMPAGTLAHYAANGGLPEVEIVNIQGSYVVQRGDTLSDIARAHAMTLTALRQLNSIPQGSSMIRAGQRLHVGGLGGDGETHVVRRGETLSLIAATYGVRLASLLQINQLSIQSLIHPGQRLQIPSRGTM